MKTLLAPLAAFALLGAANPATAPAKPGAAKPAGTATQVDMGVLHVQVILDKLGFSPQLLDGRGGQSLTLALKGFQMSRGLPATGRLDDRTRAALKPYERWAPTRQVRLDPAAIAGPFTPNIPKDEDQQAQLPCLCYKNPLEALAERFHTTPQVLIALNSAQTQVKPGVVITVPNAFPTSRAYADKDATWVATLNSLNVEANAPQAAKVVVSKSAKALRVFDAQNRLVAQFPVTTGSQHDPLPLGTWKIQAVSKNPPFHFNPDLFWDAKSTDKKALLKPGPNGPVGVVWLDLSKEHYGIHGTPNPELIGRTESHGCVRMTNWDAARLALMVKPGTPAIFTS